MNNLKHYVLALACAGVLSHPAAQAQSTAFTYQGALNDFGAAANGSYDISFAAYDAATSGNLVGPIVTNAAVTISNGLFTTTVDLGSGVFTGGNLWLEIAVSTNAANNFATIVPRQQFTPTPYALYAQSALFAATAGTATAVASSSISVDQLNTAAVPVSGQVLAYNGTQLVWQDPVVGGNTGGWSVTGNLGTTAGNFLGTLDAQPLVLKVGNVQAMLLQPGAAAGATPSLVGGFSGNSVGAGWSGGVIGGGGHANKPNLVASDYAAILGGYGNTASGNGSMVIGVNSSASGDGDVAIGYDDVASGGGSSIAMGELSVASGAGSTAIGDSTIASGVLSTAIGTVATASGAFSMALGYGPGATNDYSFVWSDGTPFYSLVPSQFLIHAAGGVGIGTAQTPTGGLRVDSGGLAVTGASSPNYPGAAGVFLEKFSTTAGAIYAYDYKAGGPLPLCLNSPGGNVGIGTLTPTEKLTVHDSVSVSGRIETTGGQNAWARVEFANANGQWNVGTSRGYNGDQLYFNRQGVANNALALQPSGDATFSGNASVCTLTVRGGCDLAEPFATTEPEIEKGAVVVIDPDRPGLLKLSSSEYDTHVAGVISGANGINPGIALHQEGVMEGGENVALTGRVYVLADASNGPISPGDLLTTSSTPGHAMRVTDHAKAQGAILGKAMGKLSQGAGMVLVLVSLQ